MGRDVAVGSAGTGRARSPTRPDHQIRFGAGSILLHAAVAGVLTLVVTRPPPIAWLDQAPVELVFEQPVPASNSSPEPRTPPIEPTPPPTPEPPPPAPEPASPPDPEPARPTPVIEPPRAEPVPLRPAPKPRPPPPKQAPSRPPLPAENQPPRAPLAQQVPQAAAVIDPRWTTAVSGMLAARKIYPEGARRRGEEGQAAVRFSVDRSGRVVEAVIASSSGSALLDQAALELLRQAVLPAFPPDMTQPRITITTMIRYSLR